MTLGYVFMLLALLSWSVLGVLYKIGEQKHCRPIMINFLLSLFASAFLYGGGIVMHKSIVDTPRFVLLLALLFGVNGAVGTISVQHALKYGKLSTSWLVINLATGASTLAAVLIYREAVTFWKGLALIMMGVAIVLLWKDMQREEEHGVLESPSGEVVSEKCP